MVEERGKNENWGAKGDAHKHKYPVGIVFHVMTPIVAITHHGNIIEIYIY